MRKSRSSHSKIATFAIASDGVGQPRQVVGRQSESGILHAVWSLADGPGQVHRLVGHSHYDVCSSSGTGCECQRRYGTGDVDLEGLGNWSHHRVVQQLDFQLNARIGIDVVQVAGHDGHGVACN